MAGITTVPSESSRAGLHPCACTHLFVFPPPLLGAELGHVCDAVAVSCRHLCLHQHPVDDLKLVQTKGHDKLGVGVTEESHKVPWYKFSMGSQGPSKPREGKAGRDEGQGGGTREGPCE
jgi:hypothetical protein